MTTTRGFAGSALFAGLALVLTAPVSLADPLDGHYIETETYPEIAFTSTDVERDGDEWTVTGDLTVKGTTKPIVVEFESTGSARDPFGNLRIGFEGHTTLSRKEWGLTWNAALETGGFLVSDKIKLEFDISAIQK